MSLIYIYRPMYKDTSDYTPPPPFLLFVLQGFFYFAYKSPCTKAPLFVSPAKPLTKMCKPIINIKN